MTHAQPAGAGAPAGDLTVARDGSVATLTLARPERRNPLSLSLIRELSAALDAIATDDEVRAVVLAAEGPAFSAGHDLKEMVDREPAFYEELFAACGELMMRVHRLPQPVVAASEQIRPPELQQPALWEALDLMGLPLLGVVHLLAHDIEGLPERRLHGLQRVAVEAGLDDPVLDDDLALGGDAGIGGR